jgi:hypothetical protein
VHDTLNVNPAPRTGGASARDEAGIQVSAWYGTSVVAFLTQPNALASDDAGRRGLHRMTGERGGFHLPCEKWGCGFSRPAGSSARRPARRFIHLRRSPAPCFTTGFGQPPDTLQLMGSACHGPSPRRPGAQLEPEPLSSRRGRSTLSARRGGGDNDDPGRKPADVGPGLRPQRARSCLGARVSSPHFTSGQGETWPMRSRWDRYRFPEPLAHDYTPSEAHVPSSIFLHAPIFLPDRK